MAREIDEFVSERDGEITDYLVIYPDTACGDTQRPLKYFTDKSPEEVLDVNAKSLKVDTTSNSDSNVLYESRAVAKNLTGISANTTLSEKSNISDSLGGIAEYTNVGSFTSFVHPSSNGAFANSLATNGNGNLIIVGNKTFSSDGYYVGVGTTTGRSTFYGVAYMFERTNSNNFKNKGYIVGEYSKVGYGATNTGDDFGHSVAMSADGKTVVVSGPTISGESTDTEVGTTDCGVVWIYDFISPGSCGSGYFERVAKFEGEEQGDLFGESVALSADAKIVVVGATGAGVNGEGYAYVYERSDNSYSQVAILTGPASGNFGSAVSVSADGNTIVVGDSAGSDTYVFDRDEDDVDEDNECGIFELVAILSNTGGTKVCISDDGQTIITAGATNSVIYGRLGDTFTVIGTIGGGSSAIACSSDGKVITTASSSAYRVYNREGNTFYLNYTRSSTINSFDMSSNTKTLYRGIISEDKVYCDDQVLETFVYSDVDGNIGIATINPTERLHVIGNAKFSGSITAQSSIISGVSTLGVTNTTSLTSQQVNVSGITTLGFTSTTNLISQQLNVSGIVTAPTYVSTGTTAVYTGINTSTVNSNTTAFHYIFFDTANSAVDISNFGNGKKFEIIAQNALGSDRELIIRTSISETDYAPITIGNRVGVVTDGTITIGADCISYINIFNMNGLIIGSYTS